MKGLRIIVVLIAGLMTLSANAQSSCEKLYSSGVKLQQTMTVASQKKAITYFEKAKVCYDSKAKKDLCEQQIKSCKNIIAQLSKKDKQPAASGSSNKEEGSQSATPNNIKAEPAKKDVQLSIDCTYLKFKGKGGEFKKAKVTCNYPDWKIAEKPEWVKCSKNEDEIVVECEKNPSKDERSGSIIIECGDKSVTLTIIQEKFKKFGVI
ncbi:MAG: BACON domain-containing protein [Muribaculaceae bacterium]|nr:BACON domain-containing protein [Muribaculaceae bacterium]